MKTVEHYKKKTAQYYDFISEDARQKLQLTDEAYYSVSSFSIAFDVAYTTKAIMTQMGFSEYDFMDCTACVGGDSFAQSLFARKVECYELIEANYACFINNMKVLLEYGFESTQNIYCFNESSIPNISHPKVILKPYCAIIDPPWGGPDFMKKDRLRLTLGDQPIEALTKQLLQNASMVVLKLPRNYDKDHLQVQLAGYQILPIHKNNVLFCFVLPTSFDMPRLKSFCSAQRILADHDLLLNENEPRLQNLTQQLNCPHFKDVQRFFRYLVDDLCKKKSFYLLVKKAQQPSNILKIAAAIALSNHIRVFVHFQQEIQKQQFVDLLQKFPPYLQKTADPRQTVTVLEFRTNQFDLSIGDDSEMSATYSIVNIGTPNCSTSILRSKDAEVVAAKVLQSVTGFVDWVLK